MPSVSERAAEMHAGLRTQLRYEVRELFVNVSSGVYDLRSIVHKAEWIARHASQIEGLEYVLYHWDEKGGGAS